VQRIECETRLNRKTLSERCKTFVFLARETDVSTLQLFISSPLALLEVHTNPTAVSTSFDRITRIPRVIYADFPFLTQEPLQPPTECCFICCTLVSINLVLLSSKYIQCRTTYVERKSQGNQPLRAWGHTYPVCRRCTCIPLGRLYLLYRRSEARSVAPWALRPPRAQ
jgi:hypothetical protein